MARRNGVVEGRHRAMARRNRAVEGRNRAVARRNGVVEGRHGAVAGRHGVVEGWNEAVAIGKGGCGDREPDSGNPDGSASRREIVLAWTTLVRHHGRSLV
jgi:hypothetical protein